MQDLTTSQLNKNESLMLLHDLLKCAKLLDVSEPEFSENMTMKEMNQELRKHILEEVHPYKIYQSGKEQKWYTYVYEALYQQYPRCAVKDAWLRRRARNPLRNPCSRC